MIIDIIIFVAGFITGALVTRNNHDEVNRIVEEANKLAEKAEAELKELKAKQKKSTTKKAKKPVVKK